MLFPSGWYSRKIGGLLGTMDHEPTTDLIHSNGKVAQDINDMAKSWDVSDDRPGSTSSCITSTNNNQTKNLTQIKPNPESEMSSTCKKLFLHRLSSFQPCFKSVRRIYFCRRNAFSFPVAFSDIRWGWWKENSFKTTESPYNYWRAFFTKFLDPESTYRWNHHYLIF